mgnify:CR=1 FL=1
MRLAAVGFEPNAFNACVLRPQQHLIRLAPNRVCVWTLRDGSSCQLATMNSCSCGYVNHHNYLLLHQPCFINPNIASFAQGTCTVWFYRLAKLVKVVSTTNTLIFYRFISIETVLVWRYFVTGTYLYIV